ncbi:ferritin [Pseudothauera nasutitermitis]|uniref:Ferritin n=1 Tax=Pseudothauera nasutitermitis TaxID=2565930 RepID=A0A4S4B3J2_9RHOO|nr:ferritin [Pseudothauera nasutitermitis]THF65464.1 ferritin [Pseudothauera nasutitermitis]
MLNHDETILRTRRIDPAAPFPVVHQAVRIALYDEYAARSFHARVIEAFGPRAPFPKALQGCTQRIGMLLKICERFGIPRPLDPFPQETTVEPSWLANCLRALAGEAGKVRLHAELLMQVGEPAVRQVLEELQHGSLHEYLPAFQQAVEAAQAQENYHAAHGIGPQQAYVRHGPLADFLERAFAQLGPYAGPLGLFSPLLRHTPPAMLAGMVAGGAGVHLLKKNRIGRHRKES